MRTCNVKGCNSTNDFNNTALYQLPRNENRRRQWLESIGLENINYSTKLVFICSHHFHELSINKTLNPKKMRDDTEPYIDSSKSSSSNILNYSNSSVLSIATGDNIAINNVKNTRLISVSHWDPLPMLTENIGTNNVKSERLSESDSDALCIPNEDMNNVKSEIFCELNLDPLHTPTEDNSINVKSENISESNLDLLHIPIEDIAIDNVKSERISESNPHVCYVATEDIDIDNVKSERSSESYSDVSYVATEDNYIDNTVNCEKVVSSNNSLEGVITHIITSKPQCLISDLQLTPEHVAISKNPVQVVNHIETSPCRSGRTTKKTEDILNDYEYNKIITKLKIKCEKQHKKIKALQSQIRRNRKKASDFEKIIKNLKEKRGS